MVSYGGLSNDPTHLEGRDLTSAIWGNTPAPVTQDFLNYGVAASMFPHEDLYGIGDAAGDYHTGLDIGVPAGTRLFSPVAGTVLCAGATGPGSPDASCGYYQCDNSSIGCPGPNPGELMIGFGQGEYLILGHMAEIDVTAGQTLTAGQPVGRSGGAGSGDHVHVEERVPAALLGIPTGSGEAIIDPENIINGQVTGAIVGVQGRAIGAASNPNAVDIGSVLAMSGPKAAKAIGLYGIAAVVAIIGVLVMTRR